MKIILAFLFLSLTGCGGLKRLGSSITGDPSSYCYKGVEYIQFPSGASVVYDRDGKIRICD